MPYAWTRELQTNTLMWNASRIDSEKSLLQAAVVMIIREGFVPSVPGPHMAGARVDPVDARITWVTFRDSVEHFKTQMSLI